MLAIYKGLVYDLLHQLRDDTGTDGAATLTNGEALTLLQWDSVGELAVHGDVVSGQDHLLGILLLWGVGQCDSDIRGTNEHLGAVVVQESSVTSTLILGQDVKRSSKLLVGLDSAGLGKNHTTAELLALDTTEQSTHVITSLTTVELSFMKEIIDNINLHSWCCHERNSCTISRTDHKCKIFLPPCGTSQYRSRWS